MKDVFPPFARFSHNRCRTHCGPDQDKAVTVDKIVSQCFGYFMQLYWFHWLPLRAISNYPHAVFTVTWLHTRQATQCKSDWMTIHIDNKIHRNTDTTHTHLANTGTDSIKHYFGTLLKLIQNVLPYTNLDNVRVFVQFFTGEITRKGKVVRKKVELNLLSVRVEGG